MPPSTPYSACLDGRDPLEAMPDTIAQIESLTGVWTPEQFEKPYATGKWSARRILTHLAQTELALGTRARMALSTPDYAAQNFDQDAWLAREPGLAVADAVSALRALNRMNVALFAGLSAEDRETPLSHPEYGRLTVDWIIYQLAGHQIHHLRQLQQIA